MEGRKSVENVTGHTRSEERHIGETEFRNRLLGIMDRKNHWSGSAFAGMVPREKMKYHFSDEYNVFVRDFPDYLWAALRQGPPFEVGSDLRENIEEERYGGTAQKILETKYGKPFPKRGHPELFLLMPQGMGFDTTDFDKKRLAPKARAYREFLIDACTNHGWEVAVAVSTLFLEGSRHEWEVFAQDFPDRTPHKRAEAMDQHPLHTGYGLGVEYLLLPEVHHELDSADGEHRLSAWNAVLKHISADKREEVLTVMEQGLLHWQAWRDEVAEYCGLEKDEEGNPRLKAA